MGARDLISGPADRAALDSEIDRNYAAFLVRLPDLIASQEGRFCLMKNGAIVDIFDAVGDAFRAGQDRYPDGIYSIQEITNLPVDLGYFSHAQPCG